MSQIHEYPVTVNWVGGRDGQGHVNSTRSQTFAPLSVPPEFQGPGEGTNPEELLTASITSCYSITLGIIAANRKLPVVDIKTTAVGEVEQNGAQFTYCAITLKPVVTLPVHATDEQVRLAEEITHKADAYCIVTNAVRDKVRITIEPSVVRG